MNEKLYQLLNNDASELPKAEMISNQEVNDIMKRFREEENLPIKKKRKPKMSAVILAAVIAACGGTTVFAAAHSNLFKNLESNKTKTHVDDNGTEWKVDKTPDLNNYEMLESFANTEEEAEISTNDEMSVSVESMYCDGRTLVLGLTGSFNNGNPDGHRYVGFYSIRIDCGDVVFDTADKWDVDGNAYYTWLEGNMMLDDGTENSFSGQITLKLPDEYRLTESKNAVITLGNVIVGEDYYNSDVTLNDIVINKRIVVDKDLINGNAVEQSEDGYKVRLSNYSPASIHVEWDYPSDLDEKYDDYNDPEHMIPLYSMILFFYDEYGNEIPFLNETIGTGSLTTPSSDIIYARIFNKQERTDSELYYGMPIYKEFKFDLSELKSEE